MSSHQHVVKLIKQHFPSMTDIEKSIALYLLDKPLTPDELRAKSMISHLHISKAALTRFAKKCGFQGYREFVFHYQTDSYRETDFSTNWSSVFSQLHNTYLSLIDNQIDIINHKQLEEINTLLEQAKRVYFFGIGSSGLVAKELKLRLTRLGLVCESLTEQESFSWTLNIIDNECLIFGLSLSGKTNAILDSLTKANTLGAKTILITGNQSINGPYSQILRVASLPHLETGQFISPQLPFLLVTDMIYQNYFNTKNDEKKAKLNHYIENKNLEKTTKEIE